MFYSLTRLRSAQPPSPGGRGKSTDRRSRPAEAGTTNKNDISCPALKITVNGYELRMSVGVAEFVSL